METKSVSKISRFIKSQHFAMIALLVLVFVFFSVASDTFLSPVNFKNILNAMVLTAFLTIGAGCILISGQIDFSAGYVGTLCSTLLAVLITNLGWPLYLALPLTLILACVIGFVNASLVHLLNFQAFIATLATGMICKGLALVIGKGQTTPFKEPILTYLGTGRVFNFVPVAIFLAIIVFIIYGIMLKKTVFGRSVYLIGGNHHSARLAGLKPRKISYILFINNAVLSAVAGCLAIGRLKAAAATGINILTFDGIIAAILGGVSFGGGSGGMGGAFLGLLIINTFNNGLQVMGLNASWMQLAHGLLLLLAIIFDVLVSARAHKRH